jgi:hypothetical protein
MDHLGDLDVDGKILTCAYLKKKVGHEDVDLNHLAQDMIQ